MSEWAIRTLRRVASDLRLFEDGRRITQDVVDAFVTNLELVYRELIAQEHINGLDANGCEACELVRRCLQFLRTLQDETTQMANQAHTPPVLRTGFLDLIFHASNWPFLWIADSLVLKWQTF
jgi:hypothetical protein